MSPLFPADNGALPIVRTLGGHRRFPRAAVEQLATPQKRVRIRRRTSSELESVTLELPAEQLDWLGERAPRNGETLSGYIARILDAHRRRVESNTGR